MDTLTTRRLQLVGWLFGAASAIHIADHLRRGQTSVTAELNVLGTVALLLQVVVVTLLVVRHPRAADLGAWSGFALAAGFFAAHWLPTWSVLSDPVWLIADGRAFSYVASGAEIVGALVLGAVCLVAVRGRSPGAVAP